MAKHVHQIPPPYCASEGDTGPDISALHDILAHFELVTHDVDHEDFRAEFVQPTIPSIAGAEDTFSKTTSSALKALQSRLGIEITGEYDQATFDRLSGIRCFSSAVNLQELSNRFEGTVVRYAILNMPTAMSPDRVDAAVSQACAVWASVSNLEFHKTRAEDADFTIRFNRIDGPSGVLGNAIIEIDDAERWRIGDEIENIGGESFDMISVLTHEIGHRLGLSHVANNQSVMFESTGGSENYRQINDYDAGLIKEQYGEVRPLYRAVCAGSAAVPDRPQDLLGHTRYRGLGVFVGENVFSSFHVSPTLPLVVGRGYARLNAVRLNIRTFPGAEIREIEVWDGETLLERHFPAPARVEREFREILVGLSPKPTIRGAITVSVRFTVNNRADRLDRRVDMAGMTCELLEPAFFGGALA